MNTDFFPLMIDKYTYLILFVFGNFYFEFHTCFEYFHAVFELVYIECDQPCVHEDATMIRCYTL